MAPEDLVHTNPESHGETTLALPEPRGVLGAFNQLLSSPLTLIRRADTEQPLKTRLLIGGALACLAVYGAAAGLFQGGAQIVMAAWKGPLIVVVSYLLCLPSLYVFGAVAGAAWSSRRLLAITAGFLATVGLLMVALLPVVWLFSVSSRYLEAVVWVHLLGWLLSLVFAWRFLSGAMRESGARGGSFPWLVLFALVSFQVTTMFRPVLWREAGTRTFDSGRRFFLEQLDHVQRVDEQRLKVPASATVAPEDR